MIKYLNFNYILISTGVRIISLAMCKLLSTDICTYRRYTCCLIFLGCKGSSRILKDGVQGPTQIATTPRIILFPIFRSDKPY